MDLEFKEIFKIENFSISTILIIIQYKVWKLKLSNIKTHKKRILSNPKNRQSKKTLYRNVFYEKCKKMLDFYPKNVTNSYF